MIAFSPIILLILLVGLIIFIIRRNGNPMKKSRFKTTNHNFLKRVQIMFSAYVAVLLISVGVFFLIPSDVDFIPGKQGASIDDLSLYSSISNGLSEQYDKYSKEQLSYTYEGKQLSIEGIPNQDGYFDMNIVVDVQQNQNDKIDVIYYNKPPTVDGMKVTEQIPPPQIEMSSTTMIIRDPEHVEVKFTSYIKEFPFTQFKGGNWWDERIHLGERVILIRVPEGLELNYESDMQVEYVENERS